MKSTRSLVGALVLMLALAPTTALAYTPKVDADGDVIEPNPYITGNVTIATHNIHCDDDALCFLPDGEAVDSGEVANLATYGIALHTDKVDEPIQFSPARVDVQYYAEDADKKTTVSAWGTNISDKAWLDTANWAASGTEGSGNEVFERAFRNGAHVLHLKNTGASAPDTDTWTFDFTDMTTDVDKRRLTLGVEVVSLGVALGDVFLVDVYDGNGTGYETFSFVGNTGGTTKADGSTYALGNTTGTTFWDELVSEGDATQGGVSGDISKIVFRLIADSDVGVSEVFVYALGLDVKRYTFGTDDNGDPVYNMTYTDCEGAARSTPLGHVCLASFDPSFTYTNVADLKVAYIVDASTLPDKSVEKIGINTGDEKFPWSINYEMTFELPKMEDLTYAGDEQLKYGLVVPGSQHEKVFVAGADKIREVEKKKVDEVVTLSTAIPSKKTVVEITLLFTPVQMDILTEISSVGGMFGPKNPITIFLIWLGGIAGIGVAATRLLSRRNKA